MRRTEKRDTAKIDLPGSSNAAAMTPEDLKSFRINLAGLQSARKNWPAALVVIRKNLATMRAAESCSERYLDRWEELLAGGPDQVAEIILAQTSEGQVLRSLCPFAGLIDEDERRRIVKEAYAVPRA
jgi:hypothetical protein